MGDNYAPAYSVVGFIVLVLDVMAIYEIFQSERSLPMKLIWFCFIMLFPVIGALSYFMLASRPTGYHAIA